MDRYDVVLGPALDGGYYLIGLKKAAPPLFHEIPWSTDRVLALTNEKAAKLGLSVGVLPEWRDVDTIDDLNMLIDASQLDARKPKQEQSFSATNSRRIATARQTTAFTHREEVMSTNVALITGGAKGIGRGIALDLAAQHWKIAFCYRTSEADAKDTAAAIVERGGQASPIRCDVSDPVAAQQLVARVEQQWGQIDALINGAGPYHRVNLFDETVAGWKEMFDGNLHPIFYLAQAAAPGMKARKSGRIINFSMANADHMICSTGRDRSLYRQSRRLILTRTLAKLLAPHGITVNAISPGFIDSGSAPPGELAGMTKRIPAGYIGSGRRHRRRRTLSIES